MTYTIIASAYDKVQKAFNRYAKKANKVGLECYLNVLNTYPKEVTVYGVDEVNHVQYKTGTTVMDVMDIEVVFPEYKLGDYTVAAVIEHGENHKNIVYPCGNYEIPIKYNSVDGICEHCYTKHKRVKTVLLTDNNSNEFKQVGLGCLKEYTGVNDIDLVYAFKAFESILITNTSDMGFVGNPTDKYTGTFEYLAKCIHIYNEKGYNKTNKTEAEKIKYQDVNDTDRKLADEVINFFEENEFNDTFLTNIKNIITNEYCKHDNGFVAYSYVVYLKEQDRIKKTKEEACRNAIINYFGNVGDKVHDINVIGRCVGGYETLYGYTYVYKFTDNDNHIFVWKTTNSIETNEEGTFTGTIRGTIKAHNEYNGEKQTVLTRCKVG